MEAEIEAAYSRIVTMSTDDPLGCLEWRNSPGAHWLFLSDTERIIRRGPDIQGYTDRTLIR